MSLKTSNKNFIVIKGANHHNLQNINLDIPRNQLTVITGISGSGKSTLAFDTLYAEGQRRYVESLSAYARQFLGQMQKPEVDSIEGLPPAISIEQRMTSGNPRSTVGTTTEIYDHFRLLFANVGKPHCPKCNQPITMQTPQEIVDQIMNYPKGTKIHVLAPIVRGVKGEFKSILDNLKKSGFLRVRLDQTVLPIDSIGPISKNKKHQLEIVIDRLIITDDLHSRCQESVEMALKYGEGLMIVEILGTKNKDILFSEKNACTKCNISFPDLAPRMFSFNSPYGACELCHGLGKVPNIDPNLIVPNVGLSIDDGAIAGWKWGGKRQLIYQKRLLKSLAKTLKFDLKTPFDQLTEDIQNTILYGNQDIEMEIYRNHSYRKMNGFEGVIPNLQRRYIETESEYAKLKIQSFMLDLPCSSCSGKRLKPESLHVFIAKKNIAELTSMSIVKLKKWFQELSLTKYESEIANPILKEIKKRLEFLSDVGLEYLSLDRKSNTLSGGESQRIRLATQIGSGLVGVLYILDEPSIGLHQRDNHRLLKIMHQLRDMGNTLVVVEHDEDTILKADFVVDLGPGAGVHGGNIVAQGTAKKIMKIKNSITGLYLSGQLKINIPETRIPVNPDQSIKIIGAAENNLKTLNVDIPLGLFVCVTGVSGSGKSSLVDGILRPELQKKLNKARVNSGKFQEIKILGALDKVIVIDQAPIGRTPRSNPATYTNLFSSIRDLFASMPEAKIRGYKPGRFSFNVKGGRCESCRGDGVNKIEMHFLPDIYVECELCKGQRYNRETLEVKFKGKNISEILDSTVEEALHLFKNIPKVRKILETLVQVGLAYIKLGQSAMTLSGGEAQRIKLATELSKRSTGNTIYILDEPTTGLHFSDIHKLLEVLIQLRNKGNTILIIEHNLDVIKTADYIIDMGPEGGDNGGEIIATGTPEQIAKIKKSYTGQYLSRILT